MDEASAWQITADTTVASPEFVYGAVWLPDGVGSVHHRSGTVSRELDTVIAGRAVPGDDGRVGQAFWAWGRSTSRQCRTATIVCAARPLRADRNWPASPARPTPKRVADLAFGAWGAFRDTKLTPAKSGQQR